MVDETDDGGVLQQILQRLTSIETKVVNMETNIKSIETKVVNMETNIKSIETKVTIIEEDVGRLVDATPAATKRPAVYVPGNAGTAQSKGSSSTWTLVCAGKHEVKKGGESAELKGVLETLAGEYVYFLVTTAHCVNSVIDATITIPAIPKATRNKAPTKIPEPEKQNISILPIDSNLSEILGEANEGNVRVSYVGFHKASESDPFDLGQNPDADIVFLMLDKAPNDADKATEQPQTASTLTATIKGRKFDIPIITPHDKPESIPTQPGHVAGTSSSGCVYGTGLQYMKHHRLYSFIPNFAEGGCSGTVMFHKDVPMGCFKGTAPLGGSSCERGRIVPFPKWEDVVWKKCMGQRRKFERVMHMPDSGVTFSVKQQPRPSGRDRFLTLERMKGRDFIVEGAVVTSSDVFGGLVSEDEDEIGYTDRG